MQTKTLRGLLTGAVVATGLATAPSAFATDYCVGIAGCATTEADIPAALTQAKNHPGPDRVLIGPGNFTTPGGLLYFGDAGNPVEIIGAGQGATIIRSTDPSAATMQVFSGSVRDLAVAGTSGGGANAALNVGNTTD